MQDLPVVCWLLTIQYDAAESCVPSLLSPDKVKQDLLRIWPWREAGVHRVGSEKQEGSLAALLYVYMSLSMYTFVDYPNDIFTFCFLTPGLYRSRNLAQLKDL